MSELGDKITEALKETGVLVLERTKAKLGKAWDELPPEGLKDMEDAAFSRSKLTVRQLAGEDVSSEIAYDDATMANWGWVGYRRASSALLEAIQEVAVPVGRVLLKIVSGL